MIFEQIDIDGDRNFAYLIADRPGGQAAAVDVGYMPNRIVERLNYHDVKLAYIIATHSHHDHVGGFDELKQMTDASIAMHHSCDMAELKLHDGDTLDLGEDVTIRVIECPGHSSDSVGLLINDKTLVSGDELFVGKVGGTTTEDQARQQYESLHEKFMTLPEDVEVYPGHDVGVKPVSTIGKEKKTNPFLVQPTFNDFYWLKQNWAQYKKEHNIA